MKTTKNYENNDESFDVRAYILDRRQKVKYKYYYQKKTQAQIAKELDVSPKTIWDDVKHIEEEFARQIDIIDVKRILHDVSRNRIIVQNELSEALEKLRDPDLTKTEVMAIRTEIAGLRLKDDLEQRNIEDLQQLGFVEIPKDDSNVSQSDESKILKKLEYIKADDAEKD